VMGSAWKKKRCGWRRKQRSSRTGWRGAYDYLLIKFMVVLFGFTCGRQNGC
jgi:hypothetical protein